MTEEEFRFGQRMRATEGTLEPFNLSMSEMPMLHPGLHDFLHVSKLANIHGVCEPTMQMRLDAMLP